MFLYFYCLAELRTWQKVLAGRAAGTRAPPPESPGQTCARIKQHGSNSATSICLPRPCPSDPPAPCRVTSKCSKMLSASPAMAWWLKNANAEAMMLFVVLPRLYPVSWCLPMSFFWYKRGNTVNQPGWFCINECLHSVSHGCSAFSTCCAFCGPKFCASRISPPLANVASKQSSTQQQVNSVLSCEAAGNSATPKPSKTIPNPKLLDTLPHLHPY